MTREEFKALIDGIKEKVDETTGALLSEDLIAGLGAFNGLYDLYDKLVEDNKKLKDENSEILKVNGQLFQKIGSIPENSKEKEIIEEDNNEEDEITFEDIINEKGEII